MNPTAQRAVGALLGMMAGDSIGLPFENMSVRRVEAMLSGRELRHRLLWRWGMVSDDTEHAIMTVVAWSRSEGDVERFRRQLAWFLRAWMLCIPAATGMATARAAIKLLLGWSPLRSGVNSAGNGPLMRSLMLGALCPDANVLRECVHASTVMTHTDERAAQAALAVALCAQVASREGSVEQVARVLGECLPDGEVRRAICGAIESVRRGGSTREFAMEIGCGRGVSGFVMHTTPIVIHAWLSCPCDGARAIEAVVRLGGDTDTTAALVGGLVGAGAGSGAIPQEWLAGIVDRPITPDWARELASRATRADAVVSLGRRFMLFPLRNLVFLVIVLAHGVRRLLPPY